MILMTVFHAMVDEEERRMIAKRLVMMLGLLVLGIAILGAAQEFEYVVGGGGPSVGAGMPNLTEISDFVTSAGFAPLEGNLFLIGGAGRGGLVPGPTFGGSGWGAWVTSTKGDLEAEYGMGLGGFDLGYAIGGSDNAVVTVGLTMGMGGAGLTLTGSPPTAIPVPLGIVPAPTEQVYNSVFLVLAPYADMQIAVLDWLSVSVRAGYVWSPLSYDWHDAGLPNAPDLALDGLYVHATIAFGGIFGMNEDSE
jgi:hypothetical protein